MKYTVYFDVYGKKLRVTVDAKSEDEAKNVIRNDIKFIKVVKAKDVVDELMGMFGMK